MELYYYQNNSITLAASGFSKYLRQLLVIPTGGGKTVVFSEIVRRAVLKDTTVLVLTDRKELHKQSKESVLRHGIPVCEITEKNKHIYDKAKLFIGMVETVARRIEQIRNIPFGLIIIDEAHKGNFFKILDVFNGVKTLGCTATPINKRLHQYYQNLICPIDIPELIEKGFLAPCRSFQMDDDFSDLKISGSEYSDESLYTHFSKNSLYGGIIEEYKKRIKGVKTIVFCVNVKHVIETYNSFMKEGFPAFYVHSDMNDNERDYMIKQFEDHPNGIMVNCGILCTGYDHPPISAVIVFKKTLSLSLWLQMCGRGGRKYPRKSYFTILDFGMNHDYHGMWNEPRIWTLAAPKINKRKSTTNQPRVKRCEKCREMVSIAVEKCPQCENPFPEPKIILKQGVMIEFTPKVPDVLIGKKISQLDIYELKLLQESKKYNAQFIWRIVRSKGFNALRNYAELLEYKQGWVHKQGETLDAEMQNGKKTEFIDYVLK